MSMMWWDDDNDGVIMNDKFWCYVTSRPSPPGVYWIPDSPSASSKWMTLLVSPQDTAPGGISCILDGYS